MLEEFKKSTSDRKKIVRILFVGITAVFVLLNLRNLLIMNFTLKDYFEISFTMALVYWAWVQADLTEIQTKYDQLQNRYNNTVYLKLEEGI